ncbi:MAG: hypothetical protein HC771_22670 [Synechococcales cyanobacterium CRU_2_2]|nr:hypothetical protein [Synechococcales cyanobacterium CRU_2_2]
MPASLRYLAHVALDAPLRPRRSRTSADQYSRRLLSRSNIDFKTRLPQSVKILFRDFARTSPPD